MDLASVGAAAGVNKQVQTLEQVNIRLLKSSGQQQAQVISQLLQSAVPPPTATAGNNINVMV